MNGALASFASRRAISVFPTPVGPIRIILLGKISSRRPAGTCCLRHLFLSAIATALLASPLRARGSLVSGGRGLRAPAARRGAGVSRDAPGHRGGTPRDPARDVLGGRRRRGSELPRGPRRARARRGARLRDLRRAREHRDHTGLVATALRGGW